MKHVHKKRFVPSTSNVFLPYLNTVHSDHPPVASDNGVQYVFMLRSIFDLEVCCSSVQFLIWFVSESETAVLLLLYFITPNLLLAQRGFVSRHLFMSSQHLSL